MGTFYPDATSDEAFARAQAEYDRAEPPEYLECFFCEGGGTALVARVYDLDGKVTPLPDHVTASGYYAGHVEKCEVEIPCPWCH